jgi:hypothetical protein
MQRISFGSSIGTCSLELPGKVAIVAEIVAEIRKYIL